MDFIAMLGEYVTPELTPLAVALFVIGNIIKGTEKIDNKNIPAILGVIGIVLAVLYSFSTTTVTGVQSAAALILMSIVQGLMIAGLAVYADQIRKQNTTSG